jgi:transposase
MRNEASGEEAETARSAPATSQVVNHPEQADSCVEEQARPLRKGVANLPPAGCPTGTPTRSAGAKKSGAEGRSTMRKVALDLGTKKTAYCEVSDGKVIERRTICRLSELEPLLGPAAPAAVVAIEACREAWHVHDVLESWGNQVLLVDTTRSRRLGIGQHGRKNDKIDAEVLAMAVWRGAIPVAHVLSPHRRLLRRELGVRRALVETRAQYVTTLRGMAREQGAHLPSCVTADFAERIRTAKLGEDLRAAMAPLVATLDTLESQLIIVENRLSELCAAEPTVTLLATAPGVSAITAASFISVIDDAGRFHDAHQVESYLGLVPSEHTSGGPDKRRIGSITRKGNSYCRAILTQAAWSVLRSRSNHGPLHAWAQAVAKRRGKKIAVVATARRLAGILWAMWRDGTAYEPKLLEIKGARGLRIAAQKLEDRAAALECGARKLDRRLKNKTRRRNKLSSQEVSNFS